MGARFLLPQDLVGNGALVSIANKYSETPIDKAKMPLREILKGRRLPPARRPCLWLLQPWGSAAQLFFCLQSVQRSWART